MKYITSTTGEKIEFSLTSTKKLILDPIVPTEVSEEEYLVLESRLGSQIALADMSPTSENVGTTVPETVVEATDSTEVPASETPAEETTPEVVPSKVVNVDIDGEIIDEDKETV